MLLDRLYKQDALTGIPKWMINSVHYLTIMGSEAYGVSSGDSDVDLYGFCAPPRHITFPHEAGEIAGFGTQIQRFNVWQQHHIKDPSSQKEYDFAIFGIVNYFQLLMNMNPNITDSIFSPRRCVIHSTQMGEHVKENRKLFLHKGAYAKFKGYSYSQFSKLKNKSNSSNEKRAADIEAYGYDSKFLYHIVRLLDSCEQILVEHDLDIERNREQLKSVRRGEWGFDRIESWFQEKEKALEIVYANSTLRHGPDEPAIKNLLLECLEMTYGSIDKAYKQDQNVSKMLNELETLIQKYR